MKTSNIVLIIGIIIIVVVGGYFLFFNTPKSGDTTDNNNVASSSEADQSNENGMVASSTNEQENSEENEAGTSEDVVTIGQSVEGRDIMAYQFGSGETELLFVGGIHGGYAPNTTALNFKLIDWLEANPKVVPDGVRVTVIPTLNPDGLVEVVGDEINSFRLSDVTTTASARVKARFNAHNVDLNRNFACNWQAEAVWSGNAVDAGESAFSEPEAVALRDYVKENEPDVAIVYYAKAGAVYTSSCDGSARDESQELMSLYADAVGYEAAGDFDAYPTSGDATNWMAKRGVTAISVLLPTYTEPAWEENKQAIESIFDYYSSN